MKLFQRHYYLLKSDILDNQRKLDNFARFHNIDRISTLNATTLVGSVKILSSLLYTHFNETQTIIFIDEFDGLVQEATKNAGSETREIFNFIMKLISITLKTNYFVGRVLINACVRISGLLTTDANNIVSKPFLSDPKFAKFYAFTENEVGKLLKELNMSELMILGIGTTRRV